MARPLPVRKLDLDPPALHDLAAAIDSGLRSRFATSSAVVESPPDLRQPPFFLAARGLAGHPRVGDIGGPPNLTPMPNREARYDLLEIARLMEMPLDRGGLLIGAGAGPFHVLGRNSELMPNLAFEKSDSNTGEISSPVTGASLSAGGCSLHLHNHTHYAETRDDGSAVLCQPIGTSAEFGLMANLLGCDGLPGPLLHITARGRTSKANFTEAIQDAVHAVYGDRLVSLGGVFVVHAGRVKLHVMPDFSPTPLPDNRAVSRWLTYHDTDAPLVCLTVFHAGRDPGLRLRWEHTHCFAGDGPLKERRGGHYHFDLDDSAADVSYEAWLNIANTLYRIDEPEGVRP